MRKLFPAVLIAAAGVSRAADTLTPLDAKVGLWDVTTVTERSGMPAIPAETLAKMPPEQRARIEAQFKGMSTPQTTTKQYCFTKEDVAKGFGFNNNADKSCKQTIVTSSRSKQEIKWECEGTSKDAGSMKIEARDSEHVTSLIEVKTGSNGHNMNIKISTTAKWLSNACGDVKPSNGK